MEWLVLYTNRPEAFTVLPCQAWQQQLLKCISRFFKLSAGRNLPLASRNMFRPSKDSMKMDISGKSRQRNAKLVEVDRLARASTLQVLDEYTRRSSDKKKRRKFLRASSYIALRSLLPRGWFMQGASLERPAFKVVLTLLVLLQPRYSYDNHLKSHCPFFHAFDGVEYDV